MRSPHLATHFIRVDPPRKAGESHMEFFDSFPIQKDPVGFENFPLKPSAILKLRRLGFGKSYAIALPRKGGGSDRGRRDEKISGLFFGQNKQGVVGTALRCAFAHLSHGEITAALVGD